MSGKTITWDSIPEYDTWGWWDDHWSCQDWITWHRALKTHYGPVKAKEVFLSAIEDGGLFGHEVTCSLFDNEFREYFKSEGFESNIWDKTVDLGNTGMDIVNNSADFIEDISRNLTTIVVAAVIIVACIAAAYIYNNTKKSVAS